MAARMGTSQSTVPASHRRMAEATGQLEDTVAADLAAGRLLTAEDARAYGLFDEIASPRPPR